MLPWLLLFTAQTAPPPTDSIVYALSPRSVLQVHTGKSGLLGFLGHEHTIRARAFSGRIVYRPESVAASRVDITVLAESLEVLTPPDTEEIRKVTEVMRTEVLDVATYPEIRFASRQVELVGSELRLLAALTIRDRTREMPITVTLESAPPADTLHATSSFALKQTDFGIRPVRAGPAGSVRVADRVTVTITIVAVRQ